MLADAGQDFIEHPAFKPLRRGQLAVDNEAVNVAFGDKEHFHHLHGGCAIRLFPGLDPYGTFRSTAGVVADGLTGIGISQSSCYIRSAEQHLAVLLKSADASKLRVFENFHLVHIVPPWAVQQKRRPLTSRLRAYRG